MTEPARSSLGRLAVVYVPVVASSWVAAWSYLAQDRQNLSSAVSSLDVPEATKAPVATVVQGIVDGKPTNPPAEIFPMWAIVVAACCVGVMLLGLIIYFVALSIV